MLAPSSTSRNGHDKEGEAVEAIEELIAEFGIRGVIAACLKSSAGDSLEQLGGNATLRIAHVILREIIVSNDPQLEAEIMALGIGLVMEGQTMGTVGERHGVTKQAVYGWESGDTKGLKPENLLACADRLRCRVRWLVTGRGAKERRTARDELSEAEDRLIAGFRNLDISLQQVVQALVVSYIYCG